MSTIFIKLPQNFKQTLEFEIIEFFVQLLHFIGTSFNVFFRVKLSFLKLSCLIHKLNLKFIVVGLIAFLRYLLTRFNLLRNLLRRFLMFRDIFFYFLILIIVANLGFLRLLEITWNRFFWTLTNKWAIGYLFACTTKLNFSISLLRKFYFLLNKYSDKLNNQAGELVSIKHN